MPVYRSFLETSSSQIGLWKINEPYADLKMKCIELGFDISGQSTFKSELKQKQWLAARCLIGVMNQKINNIIYDEYGAPFTNSDKFISLSHSYELIAVMLDSNNDVGIDVQHFTPKIELIKRKFCSDEELSFIIDSEKKEMLHIIWTVKEAIYKKLKTPGLIFREQIMIEPFEMEEKGIINAKIYKEENKVTLQLNYEIVEDYFLAYTLNP